MRFEKKICLHCSNKTEDSTSTNQFKSFQQLNYNGLDPFSQSLLNIIFRKLKKQNIHSCIDNNVAFKMANGKLAFC